VDVTLGEHADASDGVAEQGPSVAVNGRIEFGVVDEAKLVAGIRRIDVLV